MGAGMRKWILPAVIALFVAGIAVMSAALYRHYWLISAAFVLLALAPCFIRFERRRVPAPELLLLAILIALAAVSRVPFVAIPSVQPMTFVIIASALVLGAERGFMIGALAALASNMLLGQGPWTPWQMFCWGMIGCVAGWLKDTRFMRSTWGRLLFGLVAGLLFGWVMNLTRIVTMMAEFSRELLYATYAASLAFDVLHALSNVAFMLLFGAAWIRILHRFKIKYGLPDG